MTATANFDRCLDYINSQLQAPREPTSAGVKTGWRAITISRQAGAGAHVVAEGLVDMLQRETEEGARPWTVFDKDLVEQVLKDHDLPGRVAAFMPEDRVSEVSDTIDELFGLRPSTWTLVRKSADTILHLAELGNVVVIGRGGNLITRKLDTVFHVRLVGSPAKRIEHVQAYKLLSLEAATAYVRDNDLARRRYVRKYFDADIDDPLLYHLVINTDLVPYDRAAEIIADAVGTQIERSVRWVGFGAER